MTKDQGNIKKSSDVIDPTEQEGRVAKVFFDVAQKHNRESPVYRELLQASVNWRRFFRSKEKK